MERNPTWLCVAAGLLIDDRGRWLMHRRPPNKAHGGLWEFPGGKVEPGETPDAALVRELMEELGIAVPPQASEPSAFAQSTSSDGQPEIVILLDTIRDWDGEPEALEGGSVDWFDLEDVANLAMPPLDQALYARVRRMV